MATRSHRIGDVLNGRVWAGPDYGFQSRAAFNKLKNSGELALGAGLVRRVSQAVKPVQDFQKKFKQFTDDIPLVGRGLRAVERQVERAVEADDKLPASRVAQGTGVVAQAAGQALNVDPRIAGVVPLLLGSVRTGGGAPKFDPQKFDDGINTARVNRAAERGIRPKSSVGLTPNVAPPHATGMFPPRVDIEPGIPGPRPRRTDDLSRDARAAARRASSQGDPLSRGRTEAAIDPPSRYPNWGTGYTKPDGTTGILPQQGPRPADPLVGPRQPQIPGLDVPNVRGKKPIQTTPIEPGMRRAGPPSRDLGQLEPRGPRGANRGIPDAEWQRMRRESYNEAQQKRLNRAQERLAAQGVPGPTRKPSGGASGEKLSRFGDQNFNGFANKPIGGTPPTREEARRLRDFEQYDQRRWATEHDPISGQRRGTASTFPSKKGKDIRDPNYRDANLADSLGSADDYAGDRFGDTGGFSTGANRGWHNQNTDITNEAVGGRGQVGPLKGSLNDKRARQGKTKLGKSQEAEAVNTLIDEYRFPEQYNQLEARDNAGVELPPRTGAVDPRRPQLGPRNKPVKDTKRRDNIPGGRRIEQSNPERARRARDRQKIAGSRAAAAGKGKDDGGVNWKQSGGPDVPDEYKNPDGRHTPINIPDNWHRDGEFPSGVLDRSERVSRAQERQTRRRIAENRLDDEYTTFDDQRGRFNAEAGARYRDRQNRGQNHMPGRVVPPTNQGLGDDPRRNYTDPNSVTVKGKAKDVDRARQQALGLEPEPDKNRSGSKGDTTNWERPGVRRTASGLKGGPAAQELADRRERGRTETPNINRNAGQQRLPDLIAQIQRNPHLSKAQKTAAIAELTKGNNRAQVGTPSRGAARPGAKSVGPAPGKARSVERTPARVTAEQANDAALEAQKAGDKFNEFRNNGELRGVEAVGSTVRRGINETKITGRDPAAGGRTTEADGRMGENKARGAKARGENLRTNKDGSTNKTDQRVMESARDELLREAKEMERIRAARARRRRGGA